MDQQMPPRVKLQTDVTQAEYVQASLLLARRFGALQLSPAAMVAGVLLIAAGLAMTSFMSSLFFPLFLVLLGILLLVVFLIVEPADIRRQAKRDFQTFVQLMQPADVALYADEAQTKTPYLTQQDPYARMLCVETPSLVVLIRDREQLMIVPKRCLPAGQAEEAMEFLRTTFVRRRRVMRGWLF